MGQRRHPRPLDPFDFQAPATTCSASLTAFFASPTACWVDEPDINKAIGYKAALVLQQPSPLLPLRRRVVLVIGRTSPTPCISIPQSYDSYSVSIETFVMGIEAFLLTMYMLLLPPCGTSPEACWTVGPPACRSPGVLFGKISILNRSHGFGSGPRDFRIPWRPLGAGRGRWPLERYGALRGVR